MVPGETNSKQGAGTGLSVFIHLPVQMGKPSQGWSGLPGARACREHPAATFRRLTQSRAPSAGFRGVFVPSAFVFQASADATAAKRPEARGSRGSGLSVNGVRTNAFA